MTDPLKLAIAGLGTVGVGTLELLAKQDGLLTERCGRPLRVTAVSARDRTRDRGVDLSSFQWFDDAAEMAAKADADVVVELIGGSLRSRWDRSLSTGAEFRGIPMVPLRAGLATSFDQFALTGGLGLHTGPLHVDFAVGRWGLGGGDGVASALSLSFWPTF